MSTIRGCALNKADPTSDPQMLFERLATRFFPLEEEKQHFQRQQNYVMILYLNVLICIGLLLPLLDIQKIMGIIAQTKAHYHENSIKFT